MLRTPANDNDFQPVAPVAPAVKAFVVGQTYSESFICDSQSFAHFTILARTAKTVTVNVHGKTVKRGLRVCAYDNAETFKPFGSYSMSMTVRA